MSDIPDPGVSPSGAEFAKLLLQLAVLRGSLPEKENVFRIRCRQRTVSDDGIESSTLRQPRGQRALLRAAVSPDDAAQFCPRACPYPIGRPNTQTG